MLKPKVLIVDDEELLCRSLRKELNRMGYSVRTASTGKQALTEIQSCLPDVVLLDIHLPDQDGIGVLRSIKKANASIEVIMLTAYGSIDSAVSAMRAGAFNYLSKPAKLAEIDLLIQKAFEKKSLAAENKILKERLELSSGYEIIRGPGGKMAEVLALVDRIAPTDQSVLIQGESGTGKELVARRFHDLSPRSTRPFVLLDCASLQKDLLESELFGHEKGAFTGALSAKMGLLEGADSGTLFVDEVGELEPKIQAKFLRMLETGEYRRVGGAETRRADVRIVAATNVDLAQAVKNKDFREDLFFRLSVIVLKLPPLRERREDIPLLARHFLEKIQGTGPSRSFSDAALGALCEYRWPGNVRELKNVVQRTYLLTEKETIEPWNLGLSASSGSPNFRGLMDDAELVSLRELQNRYIRLVLERVHGHQVKAAEILEVDPKTIYRKLKEKSRSDS